jgi:hypothetical protein
MPRRSLKSLATLRSAASVLGLALLSAGPAAAQGAQGTFVVQQGGREIGREDVTVQRGGGRDGASTSLSVVGRYPNVGPTTQIAATLDRNGEGALEKFVLEGQTPKGPTRVLAGGAGARLIIKSFVEGTESGREMAGGPDVVVLDENAYALYAAIADLATPAGTRLTAMFPRSGRRAQFLARRDGATVRLQGELSGTLTLDPQGRVVKMDFPGSGTVVTRADK